MLDVGTGVGYFRCGALLKVMPRPAVPEAFLPLPEVMAALPDVFRRFMGRGSPGDEEKGSKGGRRDEAGRFVPARDGGEDAALWFSWEELGEDLGKL